MRISYQCAEQDFVHAQRLHCWRKKGPRAARQWIVFYACLGAIFVMLAVHQLISRPGLIWGSLIELLSGLYLLLANTVISPWLWRRAYRRRHSAIAHETILSFETDAIECESPGRSKSRIEWSAIEGVVEGDKTTLLYLSPGTFLHIPNRIITQEQKDSLIEIIEEKGIPFTHPKPATR